MAIFSRTPKSFQETIKCPQWRKAIDKKYRSLIKRQTWTYVIEPTNSDILLITWVLRIKTVVGTGQSGFCKAWCCVRGDKQIASLDFGSFAIHTRSFTQHNSTYCWHMRWHTTCLSKEGTYWMHICLEILVAKSLWNSQQTLQTFQKCQVTWAYSRNQCLVIDKPVVYEDLR